MQRRDVLVGVDSQLGSVNGEEGEGEGGVEGEVWCIIAGLKVECFRRHGG